MDLYVSPTGLDTNDGAKNTPLRTVVRAQEIIESSGALGSEPVTVVLREGTHYLNSTIRLGAEDSGSTENPLVFKASALGDVTVSGGMKLECSWEPYADGIYKTPIPTDAPTDFTQLFINGKRMHRARYPNHCPDDHLVHGAGYTDTSAAAEESTGQIGFTYDPEKFTDKIWAHPEKAVLHMSHNWGFLQYRIEDVDREKHVVFLGEGGWQINFVGPSGEVGMPEPEKMASWIFGERRFFIENVFEELDSPGEWYVNDDERVLYYYPFDPANLSDALVEIPLLETVFSVRGCTNGHAHHIKLEDLRIAHTQSTFLAEYEAPSLGDWTIHRGGAVFMENADQCSVENCFFDGVGGTAVFVNEGCRDVRLADCVIAEAGESAFCIVGNRNKVYGSNRAYPDGVVVENNYIHDIGAFGKQVAGVFLSTARHVTVRHNLMHSLPRAGICMNDCWGGGHLIENNEIYDTVRETRDHGPFNSWGREGYWCENQSHHYGQEPHPHPIHIRNVPEKTVIRNNYFHGIEGYVMGDYRQAIDMDDGTLNFHVYNNLCVDIAISIREGEFRTVENNIIINPIVPMGMHVLFDGNHDVVRNNIVVTRSDLYHLNDAPPTQPWLDVDNNLFYNDEAPWGYKPQITVGQRGKQIKKYTLDEWQELGYDTHSLYADPEFIDPDHGDYRVEETSPALRLGFKNFDMDFGLYSDSPWIDEER